MEAMLHFECDYLEGAHPKILEKLLETNLEKTSGYGTDEYCERARRKIRAACGCPDAGVYFLVGGTQTNATVIAALLAPYEGVVSADSGHVNVHEAGAPEAAGHKILPVPAREGKLDPDDLADLMAAWRDNPNREHIVKPGMAYISHPTESGTLYTALELKKLATVCREYGIPLFLDGARLGYGLAVEQTDVTLELVAECCDVFYIGGTKVGALFGEAVVFTRPGLDDHFFTVMKQRGALLAKGRVLGIQFDTLFTDRLYMEISQNAIAMAGLLARGLAERGYELCYGSTTNQRFVLLGPEKLAELKGRVVYSLWERRPDGSAVVRLCTSWATTEEQVNELLALM